MAQISDSESEDYEPRTLAKQFGCVVTQLAPDVVLKEGAKVRPNEEMALQLVREHAPSIPVPQVYRSWFGESRYGDAIGRLYMALVPGECLTAVWDSLDNTNKERISRDIWGLVGKIRAVPRPANMESSSCCTTDGSPIWDPLLGDNNDPTPPLPDDAALRARIFARYVRYNGLSYVDGKDLPSMLPRSRKSVFTHGDIAPRNIMVDKSGQILGLIDWESAGWYPDYWEYASMMKPSGDYDWQGWMDRTKPEAWDIVGIKKARRVLF
ncbi:Fc.00g037210.m01.CDS01 [Cosmosporella sp. VM-42]